MEPQNFSKKINIIVAVLVLLAGMSIGGYLVLESRTSQANLLEQMAQDIKDQEIIDDLDHDGLSGWEENLHKTDLNNPDTDGDGYLDGEEVAAGYDPTKPAPDDKLGGDNNQNTAQPIRPEPGNLTQMLGFILANQIKFDPPVLISGQNINSFGQTLESLMDEKVVEALQKSSAGFLSEFIPPYQKEQFQFKTVSENNLAAIRNYAKQLTEKLGQLDSCQHPPNLKNEGEIIQQCIEARDCEQVNCLANTYFNGYQEIIKIPVPLDWLDIHKKYLDIYWNYHKVHRYIPEYGQDPLKGLLVIEKFQETTDELMELLKTMQADLESRQ